MGRSPMSQTLSAERYAVSLHVPLAGLSLALVPVHVRCTGSPDSAAAGAAIPLMTRSEGGGSSMRSGVAVGRALLLSAPASNTEPRGASTIGGSVITNTYHAPVRVRGALSVTVFW